MMKYSFMSPLHKREGVKSTQAAKHVLHIVKGKGVTQVLKKGCSFTTERMQVGGIRRVAGSAESGRSQILLRKLACPQDKCAHNQSPD
jgi:hypothetical protein